MRIPLVTVVAIAASLLASTALAQGPDPAALAGGSQAARLEPMRRFFGVWAGEATSIRQDGSRRTVWQTERVGPFLGGDIVAIEGRGFDGDRVSFNAFGVVSWNARENRHEFRSYAGGQAGTWRFTITDTGYVWEIPAGPTTLRYTATLHDGRWREVGEMVREGSPPQQMFEMNLTRVGDTDWPAAGANTSRTGR